jgi:4-diphosphocytidyl-2-C-methyl-D-erythritol kinase
MADPGGAGPAPIPSPRSHAPATLSLAAPAKINLYLHVTGRRSDGYHELDSLIAFAGVGDTVAVAPSGRLTLSVDGPFAESLPTGSDNIVLRAARALAEAAGIEATAAITLTKRLPVASGIGGGSADAAAALRALAALWSLDLDWETLRDLALALGADVPVCLAGESTVIAGIGERLAPAPPLPPAWLVLANPGEAVSTPAVFAARTGPFSAPDPVDRAPADAGELAALLKERRNDLTAAARSLTPVIGEVLAALEAEPGALLARMSGSGATCFALFAGEAEAYAAAARLRTAHGPWWVAAAPLLGDGRGADF